MKSKIGMVLGGVYLLLGVIVTYYVGHCSGELCGIVAFPFMLPFGGYISHLLYLYSDPSADQFLPLIIINIILNTIILYFIGVGITKIIQKVKGNIS